MLPLYHCILCCRNSDRINGQSHRHLHLQSNRLFFWVTCTSYSVIFATFANNFIQDVVTLHVALYNSVLNRVRSAHMPYLEKVAWHEHKLKRIYNVKGKISCYINKKTMREVLAAYESFFFKLHYLFEQVSCPVQFHFQNTIWTSVFSQCVTLK